MSEPIKWWTQVQGLAAAAAIATTLFGLFYVRERQLWEQSTKLAAVELRGEKAIARIDAIVNEQAKAHDDLRDRILALEYKFLELQRDLQKTQ
jgi:hypothetical protein